MNFANHVSVSATAAVPSIDAQIRSFLSGASNGEELLHALYDDVLDEPIPERMRAILRGIPG